MHCCVLAFLSCSLFLHMSFELKLLLLLLGLAASCSLFLHSHAWLSDCLIARLYQGPLDSRYTRPLDRCARDEGSLLNHLRVAGNVGITWVWGVGCRPPERGSTDLLASSDQGC